VRTGIYGYKVVVCEKELVGCTVLPVFRKIACGKMGVAVVRAREERRKSNEAAG
jgi:hypothetical protein